MAALPPKVVAEIKRLSSDPIALAKYLKILTKDSRVINYRPKKAQRELIDAIRADRWVYLLKARQIGATTGIAAYFFARALMTPNHRVLVVAHTREAAEKIFEIYQRFYDNLPSFLRFRVDRSNVRTLKFFHGGEIKVASAGSDGVRGSTYNSIHATEFAFWSNIRSAIAAILQTAAPGAEMVLETTGNGLNAAQAVWVEDNGFEKRFVSWLDEPTYTLDKTLEPTDEEREYILRHGLVPKRANWYMHTLRTRCAGSQATFDQEYPATAALAFITSGRSYFTRLYECPIAPPAPGLRILTEPIASHVYSMGVDSAEGNPDGDYSTCVVTDVTDQANMRVVATLQVHKPLLEFAEEALALAKRYDALATIEVNNHGIAVLLHFESANYPRMYVRSTWDKLGQKAVEKVGFLTDQKTRPLMLSRLNKVLSSGAYSPVDDRLKSELNSFVFGPRGKPEASSGKHDDLVMAAALSVMGIDQVSQIVQEKKRGPATPDNLLSLLQYEATYGKKKAKEKEGWFDDFQ